MNRWMIRMLALMLVLSTMAMPVFAASYVDADLDGICDNRGSNRGLCRLWMDEDGRPCQGLQVRGGNYVDADDDGICDNRGIGCQGQGRGNGRGYCR